MNTTYLPILILVLLPLFGNAQLAPNFTVTSSDNEEIRLYEDLLDQNKTVVLKFFFTSCPPCRGISPFVEDLYQEWGAGDHDVEFISVSILGSDDNADVAQFKMDYGTTFPGVGSDGGASPVSDTYRDGTFGNFQATPTFVVIAPDRTVQFDPFGSGFAGIIAAVDAAIANTGATKPSENEAVFFSASGNVFGGNGDIFFEPEIQITTELGVETQTQNPFSIHQIEENTGIEIELITPNDNTRGLSTFDLVLMNNHILGIEEFQENFQFLAADVNDDGVISTFDVILIRQLILAFENSLPNNRNWLIYPTTPQDLSLTDTPNNTYDISSITENASNLNFTIIKVGDVSGDAYIEQ